MCSFRNFLLSAILWILVLMTRVHLCSCDEEDFSIKTNLNNNNDKHLASSVEVAIPARRVFRFAFSPSLFQWRTPDGQSVDGQSSTFAYRPSISGLPDMPYWMRYKYSHRHKAGFIYGVPPVANERVILDVVATNKANYETGILKLVINVTSLANVAGFDNTINSVRLKIDNLNLEDIFDAHRLRNLKSIFKHHLWPQSSEDLHLTFISSSLDDGFRRPVVPSQKDGVVLQLSSRQNFSRALTELNFETSPLRAKFPVCPRDFKRTSVERHFREKGFAIDWCAFRLLLIKNDIITEVTVMPPVVLGESNTTSATSTVASVASGDDEYDATLYKTPLHDSFSARHTFPRRDAVPRRNLSGEFLSSLIPASILFVCLALTFGLLLCFKRQGEREEHWRGFVESFFLVVKDAMTCCQCCCCRKKPSDVADNPLLAAQRDFQARISKVGVPDLETAASRQRRASSVQRQTDTLRRLAQMRDVTPRLQTPASFPDGRSSPNGSMFQDDNFALGSRNGTPAYRSSMQRDVLDNLPRPAPPPYAPHTTSMYSEDDGTYLV